MLRLRPVTVLACLAVPAASQTVDDWEKAIWDWQDLQLIAPGVFPHFTVISDDPEAWIQARYHRDPRLSGRTPEVGVWPFSVKARKALWARQGWGPDVHWAILGKDLKVIHSGGQVLSTDALLEILQGTGWRPMKARRAEFLKGHPEAGEVLFDHVMDELVTAMLADPRIDRRPDADWGAVKDSQPLPETDEDSTYGELVRQLVRLIAEPSWTDSEQAIDLCRMLDAPALRTVRILREPLGRMKQGLESELSCNPDRDSLWVAWLTLVGQEGIEAKEGFLSSIAPVPGQAWPPAGLAQAQAGLLAVRGDFIGLERKAAMAIELLVRQPAPARDTRRRREALQAWTLARFGALLHLKRPSEAAELLRTVRIPLGEAWKDLVAEIGKVEDLPVPPADREALEQITELEVAPESPATRPLPLRLALVGSPEWKEAWTRLRESPDLDSYSPADELSWTPLSELEQQKLKEGGGLSIQEGWVILRGETALNQGTELPQGSHLAGLLRQEMIPRLDALGSFIGTHPDRLDARVRRLEELRERMPHPRLEVLLLEDAKLLSCGFKPGKGWRPSLPSWEVEARRALPLIESKLHRWPGSLEIWKLWMDWSEVHPARPSPAQVIRRLPAWPRTESERDAEALPPRQVFEFVAQRLEGRGAWQALAEWCRVYWEGGVKDRMEFILQGLATQPARRKRRWESALQEAFRVYISRYQAALSASQRTAERQRLDAELEVMKVGLSRLK